MVQIIWFDPASVVRVRRQPAWKRILDALEDVPPDTDLDEGGSGEEPVETEDRREIFEVLARGEITDARGIEEALGAGVRDGGKFAVPIKLLTGELSFPSTSSRPSRPPWPRRRRSWATTSSSRRPSPTPRSSSSSPICAPRRPSWRA